MAAKYELNDASVIVVIGSGAGGGTLANELCQKGDKVVCLEAGSHLTQDDYVNDELTMWGKLTWQDPRTGQPVWIVKAVGGSTNHWAGLAIRMKDYELKTRTIYGAVAGANLLDWPISLKELEPYYDKAESKMGVTGTNGLPQQPDTNAFKVVNHCAKKAGYSFEMGPSAINSVARDGRPACQMLGFCTSGCKIGAKWSTLYTEIPKAVETGKFELRPNCMALQIQHDAKGLVTGVLYADKDGEHRVQKARIVCVAGNSIESPRLLLNSASNMFKDGMANSSGQVGRNYMRHATQHMYATFDRPVHAHRGIHAPAIMRSEARHDPARGFAGGYHLEIFDVGFPLTALSVVPGGWGRKVSNLVEQYDYMVAVWTCGEDLAQADARITLDGSVKDQYGLPIPNVASVKDHPNDVAMLKHARNTLESIYRAGNAKDVAWRAPFPNSHNMGSVRMSAKPADGVCNGWGQTHDIKNLFISDGSQFTSSGAPNPTLTIVALARRQAGHKTDWERRNLRLVRQAGDGVADGTGDRDEDADAGRDPDRHMDRPPIARQQQVRDPRPREEISIQPAGVPITSTPARFSRASWAITATTSRMFGSMSNVGVLVAGHPILPLYSSRSASTTDKIRHLPGSRSGPVERIWRKRTRGSLGTGDVVN